MQPQFNIPDQLLNNGHLFEDDFFTSRPLSLQENSLLLPNGKRRQYQFPTYFNEVIFNAGIFFANYQKVKEQLPKSLRPVSVPNGRAMVVFASYHYGQIHEMPGYNEVLVMVPVLHKSISIPLIPPLLNNYPGMGYYILALPMTNLENQLRGQQFWGLPKALHDVTIERKALSYVTSIKTEGDLDFEFNLSHQGKTSLSEKTNQIYSVKNNQLIRFENHFSGQISSTKNWGVLLNKAPKAPKAHIRHGTIQLGSTPLAAKLAQLDINPTAFQTRHCANLKSCLYLPNESL